MKTSAPISYYGADSAVASQIGVLFGGIPHVTIPFAGGMGVVRHLTARGIIAGDADELLITFYRCITGVYGDAAVNELRMRCERTLSHPTELSDAQRILNSRACNPVAVAWAYWACSWLGRKGNTGTQAKPSHSVRMTADGGNNASRLAAVVEDLEGWQQQLRRCEFVCMDFAALLRRVYDRPDCGVYCDPPWVGAAGERYTHGFTPADHDTLRDELHRFASARVVLRYGDCAWVREAYAHWHTVEVTSRSQANRAVGELVLTNKPT